MDNVKSKTDLILDKLNAEIAEQLGRPLSDEERHHILYVFFEGARHGVEECGESIRGSSK